MYKIWQLKKVVYIEFGKNAKITARTDQSVNKTILPIYLAIGNKTSSHGSTYIFCRPEVESSILNVRR